MNRLYRSPSCWLMLATGLLFSTCGKQDPLPQNTQTGANTLGCLINGKAYIPDGGKPFSGIKPIYGGFFGIQKTPYRIGVFIYTYAQDKQQIQLYLNDYQLGQHTLKYNTSTMPAALFPKDYGMYLSSTGEEYYAAPLKPDHFVE